LEPQGTAGGLVVRPGFSAVHESGMFFRHDRPLRKKHSVFSLAAIGEPPAPPAMKKDAVIGVPLPKSTMTTRHVV
jgi:hypothetical protein